MKVNRLTVNADQNLDQFVNAVVQQYIEHKQPFSAHDITLAIRKLVGPMVEIRHEDVRSLVHAIMVSEPQVDRIDNGTYIQYIPKNEFKLNIEVLQSPSEKVALPPSTEVFELLADNFDSSVFSSAVYNIKDKLLTLYFWSGSVVRVYDVTLDEWNAFNLAASKGRHYFANFSSRATVV